MQDKMLFENDEMVKSIQEFIENSKNKIEGKDADLNKCKVVMPFDNYNCVVKLVGTTPANRTYKVAMNVFGKDQTEDDMKNDVNAEKSIQSELIFSSYKPFYSSCPVNSIKLARGLGTSQLLFGEIECLANLMRTKNQYGEIWDFVSKNRSAFVKSNVKILNDDNDSSGEENVIASLNCKPKCNSNYNKKEKFDIVGITQKQYNDWIRAKEETESFLDKHTPDFEPIFDEEEYNDMNSDDVFFAEDKNWIVRMWHKICRKFARLFSKNKEEKQLAELEEVWKDKR